jgi:hypothetical protein
MADQHCKKGDKILYITPAPAVPPEVSQLQETVGSEGAVKIISRTQITGDKIGEPSSAYDVVISIGASAAGHQTDFLFELARVLKPSGSLVLREPLLLGSKEGIVTALRTESEVESALLISGFTSTTFQNTQGASSVASFPALNGSADVQTQVATYEIRAVKPNWEFGASAALSLPKSKPVSAAPVWSLSADDTIDESIPVAKPAAVGSTWKLDADDDDNDLIEDDALLEKEDLAKPDAVFDCGTSASGKKKACKNCSCGLAEELEAGQEVKKKTPEQASSCGSCYLGDAFRCASCPYLGLPAFKPGEKISLANME